MIYYYWISIHGEWVPAGYNDEQAYWYVPGRIAVNDEIEEYGSEINFPYRLEVNVGKDAPQKLTEFDDGIDEHIVWDRNKFIQIDSYGPNGGIITLPKELIKKISKVI